MTIERSVAGTWYNQHGSMLELKVDAAGRLSGEFHSHAGLAKPSDTCVVTGFAAGELIVFAVDFGRFDSLTSWTGHHLENDGEDFIRACWHMTVLVPALDRAREMWRGVWTGEDEFRRSPLGARPGGARQTSHPFLYWR